MRERKGPSAPWRWEGEGAAPEAVTPQPCTAPLLGVSRRQLSDLVNGHAGISPEMAIRLDKAFGGGAETWHRLQSAYDMAQALKHADRINVQRILVPAPAE